MSFVVSERSLGTAERDWLACRRLAACRDVDLGGAGHVVVLAPHPDDEVLAVGGTMRALALSGRSLSIVAVTDGEGSHPRSTTTTPAALGVMRDAERAEALARLGVPDAEVIRLHVRDGGIGAAEGLPEMLEEHLRRASLVIAPWHRDGHPDHDALGDAALAVTRRLGKRLLQYPVWAWHWARPGTEDLPWSRARRHRLGADVLAAKRASISAYRSQVAPLSDAPGDEAVLPDAVLDRFRRPFEVVFE